MANALHLRVFSLALALCTLPLTATAKDKSIVLHKTDAIVTTVDFDGRLSRFPNLHPAVLEEASHDCEMQLREAEASRRNDPRAFGGKPWTFEVSYHFRSEVGRYVSVLKTETSYTGGAHPNTAVGTWIWDHNGKRKVDFYKLLPDAREDGPTLSALSKLVRQGLVADKKRRGIEVADPENDEWLKHVQAKVDKIGSPSFAPSTVTGKSSGLTFHFSPGEVGPYAEGVSVAFVPWQAAVPLLKPDLKGLFAGERPANDLKDD